MSLQARATAPFGTSTHAAWCGGTPWIWASAMRMASAMGDDDIHLSRVELLDGCGDPVANVQHGFSAGDRQGRVRPVVGFGHGPGLVVSAPLQHAKVLLTKASIEGDSNPEARGEDLGGLDGAYQVTGDDPFDRTAGRGKVGGDQAGGPFRLLAAPLGEPRMRGLALGQAEHVPLRLAVAHEADRLGHAGDHPIGCQNARGTGTR